MSNLLSRPGYRGIGNGAVVVADPFNGDEGVIADYLNRELGVAVQFNRDIKLTSAMKEPETWLTDRGVAINKVLREKIAPWYKSKLQTYIGKSYPVEEAIKLANASANRLLQEELAELEIDFPGASTIFSSAAYQVADRNYQFMGHMGALEQNVDEKAIYKKYRAKKKAKKAKRAAKSSGK